MVESKVTLALIFIGKENEGLLVNHVQVQRSSVLKTSASSFSIKVPGTVNQLGNLNPGLAVQKFSD